MPQQTLWAPWRFSYIEKGESPKGGCIFVDLPAENRDRENLILYRGETAFVMLNAYPYTNGHLMVAPFRHTAEIGELDDATLLETHRLIGRALAWLRAVYRPDGFNVGANLGAAGGAGIPSHLHWHVVPRWGGDTNFMTTIGETRVLPQSLTESYDRLREVVERDA